jgi:hypothetical protein
LVVFSEIGYYFEKSPLRSLVIEIVRRMQAGAILLAAHWLGSSSDHILSGIEVHEVIGGVDGLTHELLERHAGFRLDRWVCH